MFGNNYETIQEINAKDFLKKYPETKTFDTEKFKTRDWKEKDYRVFKQELCGKTFYRLVAGREKLTDEYILNWRNPDDYINHYRIQLYLEDGENLIAILNSCVMDFDYSLWENGTTKEYNCVEIIHRNNKINGFLFNRLVDQIDHHNRTDESGEQTEEYINSAEYYLFDDVINAATEKIGKIRYVKNYQNLQFVSIRASQPLVDSKRPFMYTVNNAFDDNKGTAYVENTKDDLIFISLYKKEYKNITKMKLINGFSLNYELYKNNSRVKKLGDYYISSESIDESKDYYSNKTIDVEDLFSEYQIIEWDDTILAVTEIYKGNKYTDTCISELDFYDEVKGWIFGD